MARKRSSAATPSNAETVSSGEAVTTTEIVATAHEGVKQGAADAADAAGGRSVVDILSKTVYNTCYFAAYGVTYAALTAAKLLPLENAAGHGLHDGAVAARDTVNKVEEQVAAPVVVNTEAATPA